MIRKKGEYFIERKERMREGKLYADIEKLVQPEEAYGKGSLFARIILPPGGSIGIHRHTGEFEIYYILSGSAKVWENDEERSMTAGDTMLLKDGDTHGIENVGADNLEFIALVINT